MDKKAFDLFITFVKIGLFTFGGGYAMLALIENVCVEKKKWITTDELSTMTALAESTPGPIAINCATYVGYMQAGAAGSAIATFGVALPSFVVIYLISNFFDQFLSITLIANAFKGIKIAVGILIINAAFSMIKKMDKNTAARVIMVLSCAIMILVSAFHVNFSSIYLLLLTGAANIVICGISNLSKKGDEDK